MQADSQTKNRFVILDGHALLFRAYHAMPGFTGPDGAPTGAVYGFANVVLRVLRELDPTWLITCFDTPGPTFRDELYTEYKATRAETPSDLILQEEPTRQVLTSFSIPVYEQSGVEADDLIGTFVHQILAQPDLEDRVDEIVVVTGDRDLLQLARPRVLFYLMRRGIKEIELLNTSAVDTLLGIRADQLVDYKALRGDSSDNIPGVPGIGDKTAKLLLHEYDHLDDLYGELEGDSEPKVVLSLKLIEKLKKFKAQAYLSRQLATIKTDCPVSLDPLGAERTQYDPETAATTLKQFGFHGILKRLPSEKDEPKTQDSLF